MLTRSKLRNTVVKRSSEELSEKSIYNSKIVEKKILEKVGESDWEVASQVSCSLPEG